ncbi:BppU family phage baseplate upper protein [Clostridium pasteurianum]|uniref:Pectate lyase superfamily protein domain-containing protein n=1 Tax=Clostridium pasteurianum BC1 TaxID=86416 RepID=R4KAT1_CLOPA|nr:BppU family phage baseplate upper protein [Clostridium pasteurianum]AGK97619.1 protein of unknown function (DUF2479) [Clostridium pasteurianum BC1]
MTAIPYNITLDLKGNNSKIEQIRATVGDSKSIQLNISVIVDTIPFDLTDHTAKITFTKADDTDVVDDLVIDGDPVNGKLSYIVKNQAFSYPGQIKTEIEIFDAIDGRISSNSFCFTARTGQLEGTTIVSSDEFPMLTQALAEVTDFANYRTELTNARQGYSDLQANLTNKDARLDHLGFDFLQQGGVADGVTDNRALLQSLMDTLQTMGGGNIYIPDGTYYFSQSGSNEWSIQSHSNVNVYGAGIGKTVLKIGGNDDHYSLFWYKPTVMDGTQYISNVTYKDFTVDGYDVSLVVYTHQSKAFYFQAVKNSIFENLELKGLPSTALGVDFLENVHITKIHCIDCGRLWEENWTDGGTKPAQLAPGGAGIGIGTGFFADENFTISDCVCTNSGHYGIFLEHQALFDSSTYTQPAKGVVISNCITKNGRFGGIGIRGGSNISIVGCQSFGNKHGMYFDCGDGTHSGTIQFKNVNVSNCSMTDNTNYGYYLAGNITSENFTIDSNIISNNGAEGLVLGRNGTGGYTNFGTTVSNNTIRHNTLDGIYIDNNTIYEEIELKNNKISYSGGNGINDVSNQIRHGRFIGNFLLNNTGSGIQLTNQKTHLEIKNNYARDNQGTKTQQYGLSYTSGSGGLGYSTIANNDFRRNGTKSISIVDSAIGSTSYIRDNLTDDTGMLNMGTNTYVSFPSSLANFSGVSSITIEMKFRLVVGIIGGVEVFHMIVSHTEDTQPTNPKGWDLHVRNTGVLVFDVRQSTGSTLLQRIGTTVLTTGVTYDLVLTINGTSTTITLNGVNETFSSSTGTDADILTAMQNNNTTFPVYLKGRYYNGTDKTGGAARIGMFNMTTVTGGVTTNYTFAFDNYGINKTIYDTNIGAVTGSCIGGVKQIDNVL